MPIATEILRHLSGLPLVDHHVHSAWAEPVRRGQIEDLIRESGRPLPPGTDAFDSALGMAIRRHCAPLLGLPPHAPVEDYLAARAGRSPAELTRTLLGALPVDTWLVDSGHAGDKLFSLGDFEELVPGTVREVVRLERVLEDLAPASAPDRLLDDLTSRLAELSATAVGWKSIVAYRHGLDLDPQRPSSAEVADAARQWLGSGRPGTGQQTARPVPMGGAPSPGPVAPDPASRDPHRVSHPTLLRALLWAAADTGLPVQLHTGFGDSDLDLHRADPSLLTPWLRAVEGRSGPVMLLHTYPYHRQAAYLAHVYPHVYLDVGLALHYSGAGAAAIVREALEIAPFGKVLHSSDGWGLPELHYLGNHVWMRALTQVLGAYVDADEWSLDDALRIGELIGSGNARRVYGLG